jgi:hypothetical protein
MTDPLYIHRIIVTDRSGSMQSIVNGMRSGFDEFTGTQRRLLSDLPGMRMTVSIWQFDDIIERTLSFATLDEAEEKWKLEPRGWTALNDAVCDAITQEGADLAALPESARPGQVSALIFTDGKENRSQKFSRQQARDMVTHQREVYNWDVTFLGGDQDADVAGQDLGSSSNLSFQVTNSGSAGGMSAAGSRYYRMSMAAAASPAAVMDWASVPYTSEEHDRSMGKGDATAMPPVVKPAGKATPPAEKKPEKEKEKK